MLDFYELFLLQPPGFDEVGAFAPDESYQQGREMYQAPGSQQNMSGSQHDMSRGGRYYCFNQLVQLCRASTAWSSLVIRLVWILFGKYYPLGYEKLNDGNKTTVWWPMKCREIRSFSG